MLDTREEPDILELQCSPKSPRGETLLSNLPVASLDQSWSRPPHYSRTNPSSSSEMLNLKFCLPGVSLSWNYLNVLALVEVVLFNPFFFGFWECLHPIWSCMWHPWWWYSFEQILSPLYISACVGLGLRWCVRHGEDGDISLKPDHETITE